MQLTQVVILAVLVESLVQTVKPIWEPKERTVIYFVNLGVGILAAAGINYLADLDLFAALGVPLVRWPIVGVILTGILLSRGANFAHDLIQLAQKFKIRVDPETDK
jgi:hypothetical protein